jgi:hypothetical protein
VIEVTPEDGSDGVARSTAFTVRFSEAMRAAAGTAHVRVEGEAVDVTPTRTDEGLSLAPADGGWQELVSIKRAGEHLFLRYRRRRA